MTRSPSRKTVSPKRRSFFSGDGGLSAACRRTFSAAMPVSYLRVGVST